MNTIFIAVAEQSCYDKNKSMILFKRGIDTYLQLLFFQDIHTALQLQIHNEIMLSLCVLKDKKIYIEFHVMLSE